MKRLAINDFNKIFLIFVDGDYIKVVDHLVKQNKFGKILFPNAEFASSLYKKLGGEFFDALDNPDVKAKIEYKK